MPHVNANGLEIYYESHGPENAEPILLIMGLGAQMSRWSPDLIGRLTAAGHRVIATDASNAMLDLARRHAPGALDVVQLRILDGFHGRMEDDRRPAQAHNGPGRVQRDHAKANRAI